MRRKVRFSFGEEGFWAQCSCGLSKAKAGGESRSVSKDPNPISKLEGPGCLGELHSHTSGVDGDEEQEATVLLSLM